MSSEMTAPSKGRGWGESDAVRGKKRLPPLPGLDVKRDLNPRQANAVCESSRSADQCPDRMESRELLAY